MGRHGSKIKFNYISWCNVESMSILYTPLHTKSDLHNQLTVGLSIYLVVKIYDRVF